jgi:hypothetical protein
MKTNKSIIWIIYTILIIVYFQFCEFSTEPTKFRPRDLKWSVDTLAYPESFQTMMDGIWGLNKNNVYAYGHSSRSTLGCLYHFDGKKWEPVALSNTVGGDLVGAYNVKYMTGFDYSNIYFSGSKKVFSNEVDSCVIVHFDGTKWHDENIPLVEDYISCIYGDAPDNIWGFAMNGTVYHYNGVKWSLDTLPHPGYGRPEHDLFGNDMVGNENFGYYISTSSWRNDGGGNYIYTHLFYLKDNKFFLKDSGDYYDYNGIHDLWMSPSGQLYKSSTKGIHYRTNNTWQRLTSNERQSFGIHGTADDNIFVTAWNHEIQSYVIRHYNGEDWYEYDLNLGNSHFNDIIVLDNEVFAVGYTRDGYPQKSIILHGKP